MNPLYQFIFIMRVYGEIRLILAKIGIFTPCTFNTLVKNQTYVQLLVFSFVSQIRRLLSVKTLK